MMKRTILAASAALLCLNTLMAKGDITGTVKDAQGEPLEFASVRVENARTDKFVTGATTDIDGSFAIKNLPDGDYYVKFEYTGYVNQGRPATVRNGVVSLGTVVLNEDKKLLKEVVVEGIRGQMRFELDKKVFNVDANIAAAGASASELLEAIPSVEVDQDGEVSLRGNSSVTVWINGKESGLTADNRAQILEQLPAESIERIEVITNPSAKYSPEGTAGIINIVLRRDRHAGYFGSAEVGANTRGAGNVNANVNYNTGRWETFAGLGVRMRRNSGGGYSNREYSDGTYLNSQSDNRNQGANLFMRLGATYHLTDKDDIYANAFGMLGHNKRRSSNLYTSDLPGQWTENVNLTRNSGDMRGAHAELGYLHRWSDTHTLDVMASFNHWGGPNSSTYTQRQKYPDGWQNVLQQQASNMKNNSSEVKIDYTNQLNNWLKLEAGFNGDYSHENSPTTTWQGTSDNDLAINPDLYNRFIYDNDISALYTTLGGKQGQLSFSAGVRAEWWQIHTRSLGWGQNAADVPEYSRDNFALFPSAFLSYSLPRDNEVQVNYTRRIRRPWGGQLNSFRNISDPTNISYGNPELTPQYTNAFELNYIKTWTYHMVSLSAYLRSTEHDMNRISYIDGGVMYSTWANVGTQTNSGAEIVVKNSLLRNRLDLTTTVNLYNSHIAAWHLDFDNGDRTFAVDGASRDNFTWNVRCMASMRLPLGLSLQVTGNYNARSITAQGSREAGWGVNAGLRKTAGNWSFSLNCRDLFDSRKWHNYTYGEGYTQESKQWRAGRTLRLTIKYSFGNMAGKRNKNNSEEDAGDMEGGGFSGGEMGE